MLAIIQKDTSDSLKLTNIFSRIVEIQTWNSIASYGSWSIPNSIAMLVCHYDNNDDRNADAGEHLSMDSID